MIMFSICDQGGGSVGQLGAYQRYMFMLVNMCCLQRRRVEPFSFFWDVVHCFWGLAVGNAVHFELFSFLMVFRFENCRGVGRLARVGEGPWYPIAKA